MAMGLSTKTVLIAAAFAVALAFAPAESLAQAKKQAKMSAPPPPPCTTGQTCAASCNQLKWCQVQWCGDGKWYPSLAFCYEPYCGAKC